MSTAYPGLYIHVPFCAGKCCYCDFYSITDTGFIEVWLAGVLQELALYRYRFQTFDTVYFGGGTPSLLKPAVLASILEAVSTQFTIPAGAEITIEANPQDISESRAQELRALGFTRLSLGIQSFDDRMLSFLTRRHHAAQARAAYDAARAAGFENISIDLMYAVPGQSISQWAITIEEACALAPEHISCYQLTVKEGTPLQRRYARGEFHRISEAQEEAFYSTTVSLLRSHGYLHYEVSNFARSTAFYSRHNQKYWNHIPYLGIGPAAHSFQDNVRWWNVSSVTEYGKRLNKGESPVAESETLSPEQLRAERLMLGFRTRHGIELSFFDNSSPTKEVLAQLAASQLIRISCNRVMPTTRGLLVADSIPSLFLSW